MMKTTTKLSILIFCLTSFTDKLSEFNSPVHPFFGNLFSYTFIIIRTPIFECHQSAGAVAKRWNFFNNFRASFALHFDSLHFLWKQVWTLARCASQQTCLPQIGHTTMSGQGQLLLNLLIVSSFRGASLGFSDEI